MQCYGYMHTGVPLVLCMFFDHGIARHHKRTLKGSVRFKFRQPTGHCGFHSDLGTPVWLCMRARADAIYGQAYPYDHDNQSYRAVLGPMTDDCTFILYYIYQVKPDYVLFDPAYGPSYQHKIAGKCAFSTFSHWKYGRRTGLNIFETSCGPTRRAVWLPTGAHGFGPYGALNCPGASCDKGIKHLMLR